MINGAGKRLYDCEVEIDRLKRELLARDDELLRYGVIAFGVGLLLICLAFYAGANCEATRAFMMGGR